MNCEEYLLWLNARCDGELRTEDAVALEAHLAECSSCGAAAEALQAVDGELRHAMHARRAAAARLADNTAIALRAMASAPATLPEPPVARDAAWGQLLLATAAGFLLAVAVFQPWRSQTVVPAAASPRNAVARLALASGPVEVRPPSQLTFFRCPTAAPIERESIVRTGPGARCEIALNDGNSLCLDADTEVTLHESQSVEVNRGRLWSASPPGRRGPDIQSGGGKIVAPPAAQLAVERQAEAVRLIVAAGTATVTTPERSLTIGPGQQVKIVDGKVADDPQSCDALLETAWVTNMLALRGAEHPQLVERVERLLANVGAAKLSLLYEDELRRLGDSGVPPLLAYVAATRDTPQFAQRATATRIVADVATARWIADLIALLTDANADVRFQAARGLERLTGRDQGLQPGVWQTASWAACEPAHEKWRTWWAANRDRYPAARRDIPVPSAPPF